MSARDASMFVQLSALGPVDFVGFEQILTVAIPEGDQAKP